MQRPYVRLTQAHKHKHGNGGRYDSNHVSVGIYY